MSQNFKLSVSNPKSKYVAYVSVLSRISNCQGLGRKNKFEILKTDRTQILDFRGSDSSRNLDLQRWSSQAHGVFPGKSESGNLSLEILSMETGRILPFQPVLRNI